MFLQGEQGDRQADHVPPDSLSVLTTSVTGKARLLTPGELTSMTGEQFEKLWAVSGLTAPCLGMCSECSKLQHAYFTLSRFTH